MDDTYQNIEEHYSGNRQKVLIVFDDPIAGMPSNNNFNQ